VQDILNIGVDPVFLLETLGAISPLVAVCLKTRRSRGSGSPGWRARGSRAEFQNAVVSRCDGAFFCDDAASAAGQNPMAFALVSCAQGFPKNDSGDLLVSFTPYRINANTWEAFQHETAEPPTYLPTWMFTQIASV